MLDTKTVILAQVFISGMMAFLMTGFFGFLNDGPTQAFLIHWPQSFLTGWPVAFVFSLGVGPIAFKIAARLMGLLRRG